MTTRKYNRILWCDQTVEGWSFGLEAPNGEIFTMHYIGYSKAEAARKARKEEPRSKAIVTRPPPRRRHSR